MMVKRAIAGAFVFGALFSTMCIAKEAMRVERVDTSKELKQEKALFVSFYDNLYRGAVKQRFAKMGITDVKAEFSERFDREIKQLQDAANKMTALRVCAGDVVVGLAVFKELDGGKLRLVRCALDFKKDVNQMGKQLIQETFKLFPQATSIVNVILKQSKLEETLLKQFGFTQCPLVDAGYDAQLYTSYELKKTT